MSGCSRFVGCHSSFSDSCCWMCSGNYLFIMTTKRIMIFRVLLAVFSVACIFVIMELALRLVPPAPGPTPLGDRSSFFYMPDDDCRHLWSRGATNALRVAVVGDSFAAGAGIQVDDRYSERLERILNMRAGMPPVEVRPFAKHGTSTFQQIALLDEALKWNPSLVILGICLNDMEDWANPKELSLLRVRRLSEPPRLIRYSRALQWIYLKMMWAECRRMEHRYFRRLYEPSYSGFKRFSEAIEIMNDKCSKSGVAFIPVIFPLLSDTDNFRKGTYAFEYAHDAIHLRCQALNIRYLDLLPAFREARPDRLVVISGFDPHPNEIAHRMAAEAILKFLLDAALVEPGYRPIEHASAMEQYRKWERAIKRLDVSAPPGKSTDGATKKR